MAPFRWSCFRGKSVRSPAFRRKLQTRTHSVTPDACGLKAGLRTRRRIIMALLQDLVFDAPVPESTLLRIVTGDRVAVSVSLCDQGVGLDSFVDKKAAHRIGALLRDHLVGDRITDVIGVAADFELGPRRRGFDR